MKLTSQNMAIGFRKVKRGIRHLGICIWNVDLGMRDFVKLHIVNTKFQVPNPEFQVPSPSFKFQIPSSMREDFG